MWLPINFTINKNPLTSKFVEQPEICFSRGLSLALSLSLYIYIHTYIYTYIHVLGVYHVWALALGCEFSRFGSLGSRAHSRSCRVF